MSRYWNFTQNLTPGETARAEEVDEQFAGVDQALAAVAAEMNRAIRVGEAANTGLDQSFLEAAESAPQRANKVLACDLSGRPTWINSAFKFRGPWVSGTVYATNDVVQVGIEDSLWLCEVGHTASSNFSIDQATKWELLVDLTELRKAIRTFRIVGASDSPVLAQAGDDLMVDVSGGPVTVILPVAPSINDQPISITHIDGPVSANNIIVSRNGQLIMSIAENLAVTDSFAAFELAFADTARGWRLVRGT